MKAELGGVRAGSGEAALARLSFTMGEADAALAELVSTHAGNFGVGDAVVRISESGSAPLARLLEVAGLPELAEVAVVSIDRNVYQHVPTADARVRLLQAARGVAHHAVVVHVPVIDNGTHLGRAAFDAPRALLRAAGLEVAEPGDRFGPQGFCHAFFDEEALLDELARAGLGIARRRGFTFVLRPAAHDARALEQADAVATEMARVVRLVPEIDRRRMTESPRAILAAMRVRGSSGPERGPIGRARLRRAIGWTDALMPRSANCYRRILLEVALDAGAAREPVVFGLDVGSTGHVAFADREERAFDVSFAMPAYATRP